MTVAVTPDLIASLVQKEYNALPAKRKPAVRDNGIHEWVPLSGIVAQGTHSPYSIQFIPYTQTINLILSPIGKDDKLYCLSLACVYPPPSMGKGE